MVGYLEFGNDMASRCGVDLNSARHFPEQSTVFCFTSFFSLGAFGSLSVLPGESVALVPQACCGVFLVSKNLLAKGQLSRAIDAAIDPATRGFALGFSPLCSFFRLRDAPAVRPYGGSHTLERWSPLGRIIPLEPDDVQHRAVLLYGRFWPGLPSPSLFPARVHISDAITSRRY